MNRCFKITNTATLSKLLESAEERLVVVMFYSKSVLMSKKVYASFEGLITEHPNSVFGAIDVDSFEGSNRSLATSTRLPRFECYYRNSSLGIYVTSSERDIQSIIINGEKFVNSQKSNKCVSPPLDDSYYKTVSGVLNEVQTSNPTYLQYLLQNPGALQQAVVRNMNNNEHTHSTGNGTIIGEKDVPTFTQLNAMFQIFTMMTQMGVLNIPAPPTHTTEDETVLLPNGDKLIQLSNGKYGLIKKS